MKPPYIRYKLVFFVIFCLYSQASIFAAEKYMDEVRKLHQTCFEHAQKQNWLKHAYCFKQEDLKYFKETYLSLVKNFDPAPFEAYFNKKVSKVYLNNRLDEFEFFAAFVAGSFQSSKSGNVKIEIINTEIKKIVEHQGIYYVRSRLTIKQSEGNQEKILAYNETNEFTLDNGEIKAILTKKFHQRLDYLVKTEGKARKHPNEIWMWEDNFRDLPNYIEEVEIRNLSNNTNCGEKTCTEVKQNGKTYYHAYAISKKNFKKILVGKWSGGDCQNDFSIYKKNGKFQSQFPEENGIYAWSGRYKFDGYTYIEIGKNNGQEGHNKEHNEAILYYVPAIDHIVYKGTRSLDADSPDGFYYYEGPEFYYLKRCL